MEYTVQKLAQMAGVSGRTLRYYDEIGLLKPARVNSSGYRIYSQKEVNKLQHILFYRELGLNLDTIQKLISTPDFDRYETLKDHHTKLLRKRAKLDKLIENVEKTMDSEKGRIVMTDKEKFEGFKDKMIEENEKKYGKEIRKKYGDDTVNRSNQKLKGMSQEDYQLVESLGQDILTKLEKAMETGDPESNEAQEVAAMHKQWLTYWWESYSKEAHAGLAQMYVDDDRFTKYYDDKSGKGAAEFLRDAIVSYTSK
ncbi:MerR family transcriptional regulator [Terrilactibacillus sp. BCM23-1]|uniref:MerR family transcriptional regulator n=1 Tax=Terrilactibacillus tamarindi TaxID=2599694 RepID=A0A6N8CRV4_9BACI|nr:MerR family transcriptional regulator [Terrilactibacillus tamarindi]MTT30716.1 MerR family transcriptional regulator [Terrilactibacillus tamarindi]